MTESKIRGPISRNDKGIVLQDGYANDSPLRSRRNIIVGNISEINHDSTLGIGPNSNSVIVNFQYIDDQGNAYRIDDIAPGGYMRTPNVVGSIVRLYDRAILDAAGTGAAAGTPELSPETLRNLHNPTANYSVLIQGVGFGTNDW